MSNGRRRKKLTEALLWFLKHGDRDGEIEIIQKRKLPIPSWYLEKPVVPSELVWFWNAYWDVDTCRSYDGGFPRSIPWTAIKEYAEHHRVDFDYLYQIISTMDNAYLRYKSQEWQKNMDEMRNRGRQRLNNHK